MWLAPKAASEEAGSNAVRVLCPVWPHLLAQASSVLEDRIRHAVLRLSAPSRDEGRESVLQAARVEGVELTSADAERIAAALGDDPLLIGLNHDWRDPVPADVIWRFVDASLLRAAEGSALRAQELLAALTSLGEAMLENRALNPDWREVAIWSLESSTRAALDQIARGGDLLGAEGHLHRVTLKFRHDRVRDWVLVRAAAALRTEARLTNDVCAEPAFSDILAQLVVDTAQTDALLIEAIGPTNPSVWFQVLRLGHSLPDAYRDSVAQRAYRWAKTSQDHRRAWRHLRWEAMGALHHAEGSFIPALVDAFDGASPAALLSKLANGDIEGGITISAKYGLSTAAFWISEYLAGARRRFGDAIVGKVGSELRASVAGSGRRQALLILCGVCGEPTLAADLRALWDEDTGQRERLEEYLWAFARCARPDTAAQLLEPVCALWATLPAPKTDELGRRETTVDDLAADDVRSAFKALPPLGALEYFFKRAESLDLAWPITYMLHDLDHPRVVTFIAHALASERRTSTFRYSSSSLRAFHWRGVRDPSWPAMSDASRAALFSLWWPRDLDDDLRIAAFDWWSSSRDRRDLPSLRTIPEDDVLAERALRNRLERGDRAALEALDFRLRGPDASNWWWWAKWVWSPRLTSTLERTFELEHGKVLDDDKSHFSHQLADIVVRLNHGDAERILLRHWDRLAKSSCFLMTALYVGTPELLTRFAKAISAHAEPAEVFKDLSFIFGLRMSDHPGVRREEQVWALQPYVHLIKRGDIEALAERCDEHGWIRTRRRVIDPVNATSRIARTPAELRRLFERHKERGFPIDREIEFALRSGLTREDVLATAFDWLGSQAGVKALEMIAEVVGALSTRNEVEGLSSWIGDDRAHLSAVLEDTRYVVAKRTG